MMCKYYVENARSEIRQNSAVFDGHFVMDFTKFSCY